MFCEQQSSVEAWPFCRIFAPQLLSAGCVAVWCSGG